MKGSDVMNTVDTILSAIILLTAGAFFVSVRRDISVLRWHRRKRKALREKSEAEA